MICFVFPWQLFSQTVEEVLPPPPSPRSTYAQGPDGVKGVVLNSITREPIARALVTTHDNRYAALTDDRGMFAFTFGPLEREPAMAESERDEQRRRILQERFSRNSRPLYLIARRPGFLSDDASAEIPAMNGGTAEVQILLQPEAAIFGHVRLPDEYTRDRVTVRLYRQGFELGRERWKPVRYFNTYADGEFRFYNLAPGVYKVFTDDRPPRGPASLNRNDQAYGLPPVYFPTATHFSTAVAIRLVPGKHVEANISLTRREYYPVEIAIANYTSAQPPEIQIYPREHPGPGYSLDYIPSKRSLRGFLPDGDYTVQIESVEEEEGGSTGTTGFNVHGGPAENISVGMLPNITVPVVVKSVFSKPAMEKANDDADDDEVDGPNNLVTVSLIPDNAYRGDVYQSDHLPDDPVDILNIGNVVPGNYRLSVNSGRCYVASATWNGVDVLRQQVTIGPDGSGSPIELIVRDDGAEISGSVEITPAAKSQSRHQQPFWVYLLPVRGAEGQAREFPTNSGFHFVQVPPGSYRILALEREHPELTFADAQTARDYEGIGTEITLSADQKLNLSEPLKVVKEP